MSVPTKFDGLPARPLPRLEDQDPQPVAPTAPPATDFATGIGSSASSLTSALPTPAPASFVMSYARAEVVPYGVLSSLLNAPNETIDAFFAERTGATTALEIYPAFATPVALTAPSFSTNFLSSPAPINSLRAEDYINAPIASVMPFYVKGKKTSSHLTAPLHDVKALANDKKAPFTLNPSAPLPADHPVAILGNAILSPVLSGKEIERDISKWPLDHFLAQVFVALDKQIAELHHKDIAPEKRALIEVALRKFCAENLLSRYKAELCSIDPSGEFNSFAPEILPIAENLYIFATAQGRFKPSFDVKTAIANLASEEMRTFTGYYNQEFFSPSAAASDVTSRLHTIAEAFREHLQNNLIPGCSDPRKHILIDFIANTSIDRAKAGVQEVIMQRALLGHHLPAFARDLKRLQQFQGVSLSAIIKDYFARETDPAQKTLQKKLELCNLLISSSSTPGEREKMASELFMVLMNHELIGFNKDAPLAVPATWKRDMQEIFDCLTRNGTYTDRTASGEELAPIAVEHFEDQILHYEMNKNNPTLETFSEGFLYFVYHRARTQADAAINSVEERLGRQLTALDAVPYALAAIAKTVKEVVDQTQEADQASAKEFLDAYLRHQMTIRLQDKQNGSSLFADGLSSVERTGYLPNDLNLYGTAAALHNLSTDNGRFPMRGNPLQFTISTLFGTLDEINDKIAIIEGQEIAPGATAAQKAVFAAKKKTLEWARDMASSDAAQFLPPPMNIPAPRPVTVAAPIVVAAPAPAPVVTVAPIVAVAVPTAPATMREDINGTDGIAFDRTRADWFDALTSAEKVCVLSNLFMRRTGTEGSIERHAQEHLKTKNIHTLLSEAERSISGDDIKAIAQRILVEYALRMSTMHSDVTLKKLTDNGFGSNPDFLREVYNQAVKEADGYEISEGNMNWAAEHWHHDATHFRIRQLTQLHNTRRVVQALERFILKP